MEALQHPLEFQNEVKRDSIMGFGRLGFSLALPACFTIGVLAMFLQEAIRLFQSRLVLLVGYLQSDERGNDDPGLVSPSL